MNSQSPLAFDNIQFSLFYAQITFALTAARVLKSMALLANRDLNETEEYIIRFAQAELISNTAKIWDTHSAGLNIDKFIERVAVSDTERQALKARLSGIKNKYDQAIKDTLSWRNNLGAHLNKDIVTKEKFDKFKGEVREAQGMLSEVQKFVEGISIFPKNHRVKILDYSKICNDLNLKTRVK